MAKAVPTKEQTAADISAQLNNMLNDSAREEATAAEIPPPEKKTASRSNFKGELIIPSPQGGVLSIIPIKTYVAVDVDRVERHMYHSPDCLNSLNYGAMTCAGCGTTVDKSTAVKGVDVDGKIVLISDDELKAQQPMRDGKMKILEYIDEADINPVYYEDAEFVVPDGKAPILTVFATLVEALRRTGKVAKGVRVKGGKEQYFTLRPYGQHGMTMHYLRADYEVRNCDKWSSVQVPTAQVELMAQLIDMTSVAFTPAPEDRYLANVRRLIKQKAAGVTVDTPTPDADTACSSDLFAELTNALKGVKVKRVAAGQ